MFIMSVNETLIRPVLMNEGQSMCMSQGLYMQVSHHLQYFLIYNHFISRLKSNLLFRYHTQTQKLTISNVHHTYTIGNNVNSVLLAHPFC